MKSSLYLIAVFAFVVVFHNVHSKTFVVSNTADYSRLALEGSLRWAVAQANTNTGRDTITFHPNMAHLDSTITLSNSLQITGELVIEGIGVGGIKINCQNEVRGFWVVPSEGEKYEFSGLAIMNGVVPVSSNAPNGAAIYFDNSDRIAGALIVKKCFFYSCEATNGGAIAYTGTAINIDSCHFSNNSASNNGGALYVDISRGELIISNCHFENNSISYQSNYGQGGAVNISQYDSEMSIVNSSFLWNSAVSSGGAISYTSEGNKSLLFANCSFIGNSVYKYIDGELRGEGAAISAAYGGITVFHSTFEGNSSGNGSTVSLSGANLLTQNSIYYDNYTYSSSDQEVSKDVFVSRGNIQSLGGNLVQDTTGWASNYTPVATDILNYGNNEDEYVSLFYPETNFESFTYYLPPIENTPIIGGRCFLII